MSMSSPKPLGLRAARQIHRDEVGSGIDAAGIVDGLHRKLGRALRWDQRIAGQDLHAQGKRVLREQRSDMTEPDDAESPAPHLDARPCPLARFPSAGPKVGVCPRQVARARQHHGQRQFCRGDHIALRRVGHDDAASGRLRDVDVGDAQPGATHHLEVAAGPQDLRGHSMGRADDQTAATGDPAEKLVLVPAGAGVDLKAVAAEKLDALEGEFLANDDSLLLAHSTAPTGK